jgi:hypothetical protein
MSVRRTQGWREGFARIRGCAPSPDLLLILLVVLLPVPGMV